MKQAEIVQSQLDQQAARIKFLEEIVHIQAIQLKESCEEVLIAIERNRLGISNAPEKMHIEANKINILIAKIAELKEQREQLVFKKDHAE